MTNSIINNSFSRCSIESNIDFCKSIEAFEIICPDIRSCLKSLSKQIEEHPNIDQAIVKLSNGIHNDCPGEIDESDLPKSKHLHFVGSKFNSSIYQCSNQFIALNLDYSTSISFENITLINKNGKEGLISLIYNGHNNNNNSTINVYFNNINAVQSKNEKSGGGFLYAKGCNVEVRNSFISNSQSLYSGGAIYIDPVNPMSNLNLVNVTIVNCSASSRGGAIITPNLSVWSSNFINTSSCDSGGAIYSSNSLSMYNVTFQQCIVVSCNSNSNGSGGAIYTTGPTNTKITQCEFNQCESSFDGGAIYSDSTIKVMRSEFYGNRAHHNGGSIFSSKSLSLTTASIELSNAFVDGGAIYVESDLLMDDVYCFMNRAINNGGAIASSPKSTYINVTNSNFEKCQANKGGAIYVYKTNSLNLNEIIFGQNNANQSGDIYISVKICCSVITDELEINYICTMQDNSNIAESNDLNNSNITNDDDEQQIINNNNVGSSSNTNYSDIFLIKQIEKPDGIVTGESNLLSHFNLLKIFNDFNTKHLSSTYKSYVKNLPGDNYIKREKHHSSSSSSSVNNNNNIQQLQQQQNISTTPTPGTPTNALLSPGQQQQQPQQDITQSTTTISTSSSSSKKEKPPHKVHGLSKLVENADSSMIQDDQQELILLSLSETQMKAAFTLLDGGYVRPESEKKKHRKHRHEKKKRKNRDGENTVVVEDGSLVPPPLHNSNSLNNSGTTTTSNSGGSAGNEERHKRKKKSKRDHKDNDGQHIVVEH
ncbi:hypothetical protein PPL_05763 [Heterostelium album PN500]|uniref:Polymorphic outer membrane protein n=1 Tax=Heterostelium pallidum (strain ATCC 26659 / Pp 5 / PN500) TaxID=670386 RepID=D3BB31_HETP5|nr:hypothetical protein PPL_05763 [Heterostelium album PN500]EFA81768.1 hypothetical protein PPL_05763 [Heterostelium album PN500]|eukprot:XP_020433885.1 hypothetical protein PPL_05763 [Heterostelium album PN500]